MTEEQRQEQRRSLELKRAEAERKLAELAKTPPAPVNRLPNVNGFTETNGHVSDD